MTKKILLILLLSVIPLTVFASDIEGVYQSISESEWELTVSLKHGGNLVIKTECWDPGEYHKREIKEINGTWGVDENNSIHLNYNGTTDYLIFMDNLPTDWDKQEEDDDISHPGIVYHPYHLISDKSIIRATKLWKLPHRFYSEKRTRIMPFIEKYFPGWYVLEYKFLDRNLKKFLDENMVTNSPGWLIEDFNSDGLYDYAILIYRIDEIAQEIETKLVVFFQKEKFKYAEPMLLNEKHLTPELFISTYLKLVPAGTPIIKKKKSIIGHKKVILEYPAFQIIHYPKSNSLIYYWDKTTRNFEEGLLPTPHN